MSGSDVAVQTVHDRLQDLAARALGLDPASPLSAADTLRVGTVAVLFLEMDTLTGQALAGQPVDLARLSQATTLLAKMMPAGPEPKVLPPEGDAREKLAQLFAGLTMAREFTEQELRAEVERLKAELESVRAPAAVSPVPAVPIDRAEAPQPAPAPGVSAAEPVRATKSPAKPAVSEIERLSSREPPRTPASSEGFSRQDEPWRRSYGSSGAGGWRRFHPPYGF